MCFWRSRAESGPAEPSAPRPPARHMSAFRASVEASKSFIHKYTWYSKTLQCASPLGNNRTKLSKSK